MTNLSLSSTRSSAVFIERFSKTFNKHHEHKPIQFQNVFENHSGNSQKYFRKLKQSAFPLKSTNTAKRFWKNNGNFDLSLTVPENSGNFPEVISGIFAQFFKTVPETQNVVFGGKHQKFPKVTLLRGDA